MSKHRNKNLSLHISRLVAERLATAMRDYAQAAYPAGGSECAQSAREALMTAAQNLLDSHDAQQNHAQLNRRQRALTKAAIKYHAEKIAGEETGVASAREACLLAAIGGEVLTDEAYKKAQQRDRGLAG